MREIHDYNYGSDRDGLRGIHVIDYEIEESDTEWIREAIIEEIQQDCYDYHSAVDVTYMDSLDNEIDIEVDINEYLTREEFEKITRICE